MLLELKTHNPLVRKYKTMLERDSAQYNVSVLSQHAVNSITERAVRRAPVAGAEDAVAHSITALVPLSTGTTLAREADDAFHPLILGAALLRADGVVASGAPNGNGEITLEADAEGIVADPSGGEDFTVEAALLSALFPHGRGHWIPRGLLSFNDYLELQRLRPAPPQASAAAARARQGARLPFPLPRRFRNLTKRGGRRVVFPTIRLSRERNILSAVVDILSTTGSGG